MALRGVAFLPSFLDCVMSWLLPCLAQGCVCIHKQDIGNRREKLEHKEHDASRTRVKSLYCLTYLSKDAVPQSRCRISMACALVYRVSTFSAERVPLSARPFQRVEQPHRIMRLFDVPQRK